MAAIEDFNRFGRGRDNDSSSSRESSPQPHQKRSFSPPSDDDTVLPEIPDDDTPPPPDRPIIRQAVAFSSAPAPASINTYQASLPSAPSSSVYFLPGQEVPKPKNASSKKAGSTKRTKRAEKYSSQTGRFRLQAYDPTPSEVPPLQRGSGPYSAMYRNEASTPMARSESPATMSIGSSGGYPGASNVSTVSSSTQREGTVSPSNPNAKRSKVSSAKTKTGASKRKASEPRSKRTNGSVPSSVASSSMSPTQYGAPPSEMLPPQTHLVEFSSNTATTGESQASRTSGYYRHNYGSEGYGTDFQEQSSPVMQQSTPRGASYDAAKTTSAASSGDKSARRGASGNTDTNSGNSVSNKNGKEIPLRMVTILITDLRSGIEDHQLAEVKVALRPADDPQLGFWADAKELVSKFVHDTYPHAERFYSCCVKSGKLQSSPSRIDGPAKVYTMRGTFRQFFLRVSERNVDEFVSANLCISPDRTLDVAVETLLPPGRIPSPPKIPRDMLGEWASDSEYADMHQHRSEIEHSRQGGSSNNGTDQRSRKRRASPSFDDYDGYPDYDGYSDYDRPRARSSTARSGTYDLSTHASPAITPSYPPTATGSAHRMNLDYGRELQSEEVRRGYESPTSDDEPEEVHKIVSQAVDNLINKDPGWTSFFKGKANEPRVNGYLMQYEFFHRILEKYNGKLAPFKSHNAIIDASHLTSALRIEDGQRFVSDCEETLHLLKFYGKGGSRYEDSQIIEMMNDTSTPVYGAKPIKRFLRLLREIDERWEREHSESSTDRRLSIEHIAG